MGQERRRFESMGLENGGDRFRGEDFAGPDLGTESGACRGSGELFTDEWRDASSQDFDGSRHLPRAEAPRHPFET